MLGGMYVNRNSTSIILNAADVILLESDGNRVAVTGHGLINTVVHYLVHKMVQPIRSGGTNIHTRTLSDSLKPLKNLNAACGIFLIFFVRHFFTH